MDYFFCSLVLAYENWKITLAERQCGSIYYDSHIKALEDSLKKSLIFSFNYIRNELVS